jgi:uncharacterized protein
MGMTKGVLYICVSITLLFYSCKRPSERIYNNSRIEDRILDSADLLTTGQEKDIFKLIQSLEKSVGSQIAILTLNTLNGQHINEYSIQKFEYLSLGRDLYGDGILITVAHQDRETRIEVGTGLEKVITDEMAARIIREQMVPKFKEDKMYEGLNDAVIAIKKLIEDNKQLVGQKP